MRRSREGCRGPELRSAQLFLSNFVDAFRRVNEHWANAVDLPDDEAAQDELLAAGQAACDALTQLLSGDRLSWILVAPQRQQAAAITHVSTALENPDLERLLVALGYQPPQDAGELLDIVRRSLQELRDDPRAVDDLVAEVRGAIAQLQEEICELSNSRRHDRKVRSLVAKGRKTLGAILLGLILNPEFQHMVADLAGDHPLPAVAASGALPLAAGLAAIKLYKDDDPRFPAPSASGIDTLGPADASDRPAGRPPSRRRQSVGQAARVAARRPRPRHEGTKEPPPSGRQGRHGPSRPGR